VPRPCPIRCARSRRDIVEYVPTSQCLKFDLQVHYLCDGCWVAFRSWFYTIPGPSEADL
jgi:hypothetical protein